MRVRVTPSARRELLELVARIRDRDRDEAIRLVTELAERLDAVADGDDDASELGSVVHTAAATDGHRLYVRERRDTLWVLAVWPDARAHAP